LTVFTGTFDEHIYALEALFARLSERKLRLKPSKCHFGMSAINYLGYVVDADGVRTNPEKVAAIANMLPPTSVSELRRFMGACGYYQQFIPNFAELASSLYKLTIKGTTWAWGDAQQHAFDQLKIAITSEPVLQLPDLERIFEVLTDASYVALVLCFNNVMTMATRIQLLTLAVHSRNRKHDTLRKNSNALQLFTHY
jgi:hypothetical protein